VLFSAFVCAVAFLLQGTNEVYCANMLSLNE